MVETGWGRDRSIFVSTVVGNLATYVTGRGWCGLRQNSPSDGPIPLADMMLFSSEGRDAAIEPQPAGHVP